ncbi:MAG: 3-methyladenine DNA glycosylase [Candidatus Cloacimonadota bacterium]|nr:MAG: 3-methyladenine DNA glycosylase [Candidatus Cloacimonadota bacterium]PIE79000.1 MAG: 3-methyladenine DNA glycosylase [Candidatus Delongbacteria bacterium]
MKKDNSITQYFGTNLAELLSEKIEKINKDFHGKSYIENVKQKSISLGYTKRIELHAEELYNVLPKTYSEAISILLQILGEENPNETGMFKEFYWIMPIGKFIEKYGLNDFDISIKAIEEITKRNTGEYAIRPFIRKYPEKTVKIMLKWSKSDNFHLRRLSSEGLRPKLPWATKLDTFIEKPKPVFKILENLIEDDIKFVKKSVANNIRDYLKVNKPQAEKFIEKYRDSENKNTQWIIKHATRKIKI